MRSPRRLVAAAMFLALGLPGPSAGQLVRDHLACHRVTERLTATGAVDIASPAFGLEAGCRLGRAALLCTPASTRRVRASGTSAPVGGRGLLDSRLCYRVTCPRRRVADRRVADEFGSRVLRGARPRLLCVPAVHGAPRPAADHLDDLACYQARDPQRVRAKLSVISPRFGFANGCRMTRPSRLVCVAATTTGHEADGNALPSVGGRGADDDRVCYPLACPRPFPGDQLVSDRFGSRTLRKLVPGWLCSPSLLPGVPATTTTTLPPAEAGLVCQRAVEAGGERYAAAVLAAIAECAAPGGAAPLGTCLGSAGAAIRLTEARDRWAGEADVACAGTDLRADLGYAETCGAPPSSCTAPSTGILGVVDCLACRLTEQLSAVARRLYADRPAGEPCRQALGDGGIEALRATLDRLQTCLALPDSTSVAACFAPDEAEWTAQVLAACGGIDPFASLGYPSLCSGVAPDISMGCSAHAAPCSFLPVTTLRQEGTDNDLLDCLACQTEEAALGVARDLYGANLCCIAGVCDTVRTRVACRRMGGTPVRYRVDLVADVTADGAHGIDVGDDGTLYVAQPLRRRVIGRTAAGIVRDVGSKIIGHRLFGVAADGAGNLYLTTREVVLKMTPRGVTSVFAGGGTARPGDGGPATAARLLAPDGIAVDGAGNVYFTESGAMRSFHHGTALVFSERVRMVDPSGIIHTVAGGDAYGIDGAGGPAVTAQLAAPYALHRAYDGTLLVGEDGAMRVLRLEADGTLTHVAGRPQLPLPIGAHSGYGGPALGARFFHTCGLAGDPDGNVIVGAMKDNRVALVDRLGSVIGIAGTGEGKIGTLPAGDGGPAVLARGLCCEDLVVAADGRIYCADLDYRSIRVLTREPY